MANIASYFDHITVSREQALPNILLKIWSMRSGVTEPQLILSNCSRNKKILGVETNETNFSKMEQIKFLEDSL